MATSRFEHPSAAPVALLLPDIECEDAGYWQHHWIATRLDCRAVDLGRGLPDRNSWVSRLDHALRGIDAPILLVGHGAGALTIAAWTGLMSSEYERGVTGALLIAPSDPSAPDADQRLQSFAPLPTQVFPFPALIVASEDDPTVSLDYAFSLARRWGAGFARFGECGHFGPGDSLGCWPEGEELLERFCDIIIPGQRSAIGGLDGLMLRDVPDESLGSSLPFRP